MKTRQVIDARGVLKVIEDTLSDGSKVYNVVIGGVAEILAMDQEEAMTVFKYLSGKSIVIYTDERED